MLYACKGHRQTLFNGQRERERWIEREGGGRVSEKEGEGEREFIFKRNDGVLAPFSYLVLKRNELECF